MQNKITIQDSDFFPVYGWMTTKLGLRSVERDVYALVNKYTQDGKHKYYGSLNYASAMTGYTKKSIIKAFDSLVKKGILSKKVINEYHNEYDTLIKLENISNHNSLEYDESSELSIPLSKNETSILETQNSILETQNSIRSIPNNKYNNNKDNRYSEKFKFKNNIYKYVSDPLLVVEETPSGGSEGFKDNSANRRHNTSNNPYVIMSDEEREQMRNELAEYGKDAYLATIQAFNKCNKQLIDDGLNPYAPGVEGFKRYIERYGVSTKRLDQVKARI